MKVKDLYETRYVSSMRWNEGVFMAISYKVCGEYGLERYAGLYKLDQVRDV